MRNCFFILTILCLFICSTNNAQVFEKKTVHAGQSLSEFAYFLFPSFSDATVKFKAGGKLSSKMNFNMFLCQMQFIDPHGDTLSLSKPEELDSIYLYNYTFFYNPSVGYYEIYPGKDSLRLVVSRKVTYEAIKIGALGIPTHTGTGISSYTELVDKSTGTKELTMNEDVDITKETTYYFMGSNGQMTIASKSNILKMFEKDKKTIEAFIKSDKISFSKDADLQKLLEFCTSIPASTH